MAGAGKILAKRLLNRGNRVFLKGITSKSGKRRLAAAGQALRGAKKHSTTAAGKVGGGAAFALGGLGLYKLSKHNPKEQKVKVEIKGLKDVGGKRTQLTQRRKKNV